MLRFDTRDTLNVLSLAFEEKEFRGELGQSHRQRIVHILLEIMTPSADTWPEIGSLLNFIAGQIAAHSLPAHSDRDLLERVMVHLKREHIADESASQHEEREHAWLELLAADCLPHITMGDQLRSARAARFYRVVQLLLERRRCFEDILPCYLDAPGGRRDTELWPYMRRWAHSEERQIFAQLCTYAERLVSADCAAVVRLVVDCYASRVGELLQRLADDEAATFRLMHELDAQQFEFEPTAAERYVQLLCTFAPDDVLAFLQRCGRYRVDTVLAVVRHEHANAQQQQQLVAAIVYLYERGGDFEAAFEVCMQRLHDSAAATGAEAERSALELSALCTRASAVLTAAQAQRMWFAVIDAVLARADLAACTRTVLHGASRYVDLSEMVQRIMEVTPAGGKGDSSGGGGKFGDIRHILGGMLVNARYEARLLSGTARVLGDDLHAMSVRARRQVARAMWVTWVACVVCDGRLTMGGAVGDVLVLGGCGHAVHGGCWPTDGGADGATVRCPRCGVRVPVESGEFEPTVLTAETGAIAVKVSQGGALQVEAPPRIGIGGA